MADIRRLVGDVLPRANGDPAEAPPQEAIDTTSKPPPGNEVVAEDSTSANPIEATPPKPPAPEVTRFDDGTRLVTRRGVDTERGKADVTEAYDEQDRIVSTDATFADGHRLESRRSYPAEGHWSQVDTVRDPDGNALGTITTTFDGERTTRTVEPTDGAPQTDIRDKDGPVATVQKVSPALAVPFLLEFAAIGAVIIGKAISDTIARQGAAGVSGGSQMARPPGKDPGPGDNGPPERVEHDKPPQPGPPMPPFLPEPRPGWQQSELDVAKAERPDFVPQVSFKNGREVSWGTRGSVRPDGVSADMRSASFEVKNHNININTNANGLVNKVVRQVHERARHLPRGMQQNIRIDVRGQNVSSGRLDDVARRIVEKSNGLLSREHIQFMEFY